MRILGIDPGLRITGYGVVDVQGAQQQYVASGVIRTASEASLPERLHTLFAGLCELSELYKPQVAVVEIVFVNVNPQSTLLLGQARGAVLTALTHSQLAVVEYTALQIKQAIAGHGKANKAQVQEMVKRLLKLPATPTADAADALAAALTHAQSNKMISAMANGNMPAGALRSRTRKGRTSWR
ncbi:MAG TPA: crossover junction endodeoxyribonuclease RuvC [Limnobacter sp.]|nr:crossover junction endodeoxyribonuclease RuvC [Limnobacter sp.]